MLAAVYVPALPILGFFISTAILTIVMALLFEADSFAVLVGLGAAVPVLLYLLFASALGVPLPLLPMGLARP